jgi:membrane protein
MNISQIWTYAKKSVSAWIDDYAPSMGAALAYYTLFSIAPLLVIVIAVAGLVFGQEAAQGQIVAQLRGLMGDEGAVAIEGLLKSMSEPGHGITATIVGAITLVIGATTVFAELQSDLDRIWRSPAAQETSGIWGLIRTRLLSFGMVLGLGFLLLVSLVLSAALAALGKWWGGLFPGWEILLTVLNFVISLAAITALFAAIYKFMPRVKIDWYDVWVGAAVTALLFVIGKFLIGQYLGRSGISSGFGAAGSLVVLLVWVYYSAQIFLLGAEFTWVYAHGHGSRMSEAAPSPAPALPRRSAAPAVEQPQPAAIALAPEPTRSAPPRDMSYAFASHKEPSPLQAREFVEHHPIKGLGVVLALGLLIGGVLRQVAPPARVFHREAPAPQPRVLHTEPRRPERIAAPKRSVLGGVAETWKTKARRSLLRELLMAGTAQLLATGFRRRIAARHGSWPKRLVFGLLDRALPGTRRRA